MNRRYVFSLAIIFFFAAAALAHQGPASPSGKSAPATRIVAVKAGKVLDVRTGNYRANQIIWIEGDRIKQIGDAAALESQLPPSAERIDLSNSTVLPGLIDCHTHITGSPYLLGMGGYPIPDPRSAVLGVRNARVPLEAGFTTIRNVGASGYSDFAVRDGIQAGEIPGPRILASGPALSITGGHGDENFLA